MDDYAFAHSEPARKIAASGLISYRHFQMAFIWTPHSHCLMQSAQMTSRTLSFSTVLMIFQRSFSPLASASANLNACSEVILPGSGGSLGSTTACTRPGPYARAPLAISLRLPGLFDGVASRAAALRDPSKVDGLQLNPKLRIAIHHHLFPFDFAQAHCF